MAAASRETTGEHGAAVQHERLVLVEEIKGPGHRLAQRLMPFQTSPSAGQELEPVAQAILDIQGAHGDHPGRGQFDGQGDAVQAPADHRHRLSGLQIIQREIER